MPDDGVIIKVEGLEALQSKLDELSTKAAERCIRKALRAGAEIEQAAIIERAPDRTFLGGTIPEGAIKSDIVVKMKRDDQGEIVAVVGPDKYTRRVAGWVEYGHRMVTGGYNKLNKTTGKTRGPGKVEDEDVQEYPFIRPAYEATREEVANAICETLAAEVEKASAQNSK